MASDHDQPPPKSDSTVVNDFSTLVRLSGMHQPIASQQKADDEVAESPEVKHWRGVHERLAEIPVGTSWSAPTKLPLVPLVCARIDPSGRVAVLMLEGATYLLDVTFGMVLPVPVEGSFQQAIFTLDGSKVALLDVHGARIAFVELGGRTPECRVVPFVGFEELVNVGSVLGAISGDHTTLALGSPEQSGNCLVIWVDWASGSVINRMSVDCSRGLFFAPDGRYLICAGWNQAKLFDPQGGESLVAAQRVAICPTGQRLATLRRSIVTLLNSDTLQPSGQIGIRVQPDRESDKLYIEEMCFSPNGQRMAVVIEQGGLREACVFHVRGDETHRFGDPIRPGQGFLSVSEVGFSSDGARLLVVGQSHATLACEQPVNHLSVFDLAGSGDFLGSVVVVSREQDFAGPAGEPFRLPVGRTSAGFFGRLDSEAAVAAAGYHPPFEWPWMVRCALTRSLDPTQLDTLNRYRFEDLKERITFWQRLIRKKRLAGDANLHELVEVTRGWTHLLPEIAFRSGTAQQLSAARVRGFIKGLAAQSFDKQEEFFEKMMERMMEEERTRVAEVRRLEQEKAEQEAREAAERKKKQDAERLVTEEADRIRKEKDAIRIAAAQKRVRFRSQLADLGLTEDSSELLFILPIFQVALCDGKIQQQEGQVLQKMPFSAHFGPARQELARALHEQAMSRSWIEAMEGRLTPRLFERARRFFIGIAQRDDLPFNVFQPSDLDLLIPLCTEIAEAAGGFLGIGKISKEEREVLNAIEADLKEREIWSSPAKLDF